MGDYNGKFRPDDFARECPHDWVGDDQCVYCELEKAKETIRNLKETLKAIHERGCGCNPIRDRGAICPACLAYEALKEK